MATTASASENILFRYNSENKNQNSALKMFHQRPTDESRSQKKYEESKAKHQKILASLSLPLDNQEIYQIFCDELNDVYDLAEFLIRCSTFEPYISINKGSARYDERFAEYCFAKLASLCTHAPTMSTYVHNLLLNKTEIELDLNTDHIKKADIRKGEKVLREMLQSLGKEKFFSTLYSEQQQQQTPNAIDTSDFLLRIQRSSGREYVRNQHTDLSKQKIVATAETIENAIRAIHLFSWDSLNREQKFIKKVISALQSESKSITIACGIGLERRSFKFNDRDELLVCIRSNPSLCAEFKKALKEKKAEETILPSNSDQRKMFHATDEAFTDHAMKLVPSLKKTLTSTLPPAVAPVENLPTQETSQERVTVEPKALIKVSGQFRHFKKPTSIAEQALNSAQTMVRNLFDLSKFRSSPSQVRPYFVLASFVWSSISRHLPTTSNRSVEGPLPLIKDSVETNFVSENAVNDERPGNTPLLPLPEEQPLELEFDPDPCYEENDSEESSLLFDADPVYEDNDSEESSTSEEDDEATLQQDETPKLSFNPDDHYSSDSDTHDDDENNDPNAQRLTRRLFSDDDGELKLTEENLLKVQSQFFRKETNPMPIQFYDEKSWYNTIKSFFL